MGCLAPALNKLLEQGKLYQGIRNRGAGAEAAAPPPPNIMATKYTVHVDTVWYYIIIDIINYVTGIGNGDNGPFPIRSNGM